MRSVFTVSLTTIALLGCGDDDGTFQPGGRELGEEVSTTAEYITHSCAGEVQACLIPCPGDDLYVAINPTDYANSEACGACMEVTGPLRAGELVQGTGQFQ